MFEYTQHNHFKFGYDHKDWFVNRSNENQEFVTSYGRAETNLLSWRKTNVLAAQKIRMASNNSKIWLLYSGGIDSEVCVKSFMEANISFQVAIMRYENDSNIHDIRFALDFCKRNDLSYKLFDLNISKFWGSHELYQIVDLCHCVSPQLAACLWLGDQVDGIPVIAQGESYLKKIVPDDYVPGVSPYLPSPWHYIESDRLCSLFRYFIFKNKPAVPAFFQYLPEQILSFVTKNHRLQMLIANQVPGKLGTRSSKFQMYTEDYPELEPREKLHGFEKFDELHKKYRTELAQRFPLADEDYSIPVEKLIQQLSPIEKFNAL